MPSPASGLSTYVSKGFCRVTDGLRELPYSEFGIVTYVVAGLLGEELVLLDTGGVVEGIVHH